MNLFGIPEERDIHTVRHNLDLFPDWRCELMSVVDSPWWFRSGVGNETIQLLGHGIMVLRF
jgi:hypothetical protein